MKRRLLSLLLVLLMCISLFPLTAMAAGYSDTSGHWAEAEITKWSGAGILTGSEGNFRPNDSITRAEMATIFDRLMAYGTKAENKFTDLGTGWYTDAILRANAAGLMLGSGSLVRPNDKITRQEAAILICRAMGIPEKSGSTSFADDTSIAGWARGYVNALSSAGLIAGVGDNRFAPTDSINRASVVKMLDNAIKGFFQKSGEYTGDVAGNAVVNTADVTLKNMTISGNLIIAEGVGDGDVTLDNVKVNGKLIARGGGVNSIHIIGNSQVSSVIIQKTDDGGIRVVTESGSVVEAVFIDDGKDDVILTGSFKAVTVAAGVPVSAVGANIASVTVTGAGASLTVDSASKITAVTVAETAAKAEISVKGEVDTLTANAAITVNNQGTIKAADIKADNVIIDGNKPNDVKVDSSVTAPPKSSDGKPVEGGGTPPSGGGGYVPPVDPKVANVSNLAELRAALEDEKKEIININADISGIENTIKVERKVAINGNNKTLTFKSLADKADGERNGLLIMTDGVTVKDLNIIMADNNNLKEDGTTPKWDGVYGIQVYNSKDVVLKDCLATGGDAAILVNGSEVVLEGTTNVSDNEFGGIEVSKGAAEGLGKSVLTVNGAVVNTTEAENLPTVWVDGADGGTVEGSNALRLNVKPVSGKNQKHYFLSEVSNLIALKDAQAKDYMKAIAIVENIALDNASKDFVVKAGDILFLAPGKTLTVPENGSITVKGELYNEGTIGSITNHVKYIVDEAKATVTGGGTFYGSILVKAEEVQISNVTIYNQGDANTADTTPSTWNRAGIYAYCDNITIKDCTFNANKNLANSGGICNGAVILPKSTPNEYTISGNTFNGYAAMVPGYSSAGLIITGGITKDFLSSSTSVVAELTVKQDLAIIEGNIFNNCTNDYVREDWSSGNKIFCKANSSSSNLVLKNAASSAKYYITGNVTLNSDAEVKAGTELVIATGKTLTIASGKKLTVNGRLEVNGTADFFNGAIGGTGTVVVNSGATAKLNLNASELPNADKTYADKEMLTFAVVSGGKITSMTTNSDTPKDITLLGNTDDSRIKMGDTTVIGLGFSGKDKRPGMIIQGDVSIPKGQTFYSMFGSAGNCIGLNMLQETGAFTVGGTLKMVSADGTGSALVVGSGAKLVVSESAELSIALKAALGVSAGGTLEIKGTVTGAERIENKGILSVMSNGVTLKVDANNSNPTISDKLYNENEIGAITEEVSVTGTSIKVSLAPAGDTPPTVRIQIAELSSGLKENVQVIAKDTSNNWYNIIKSGWGPPEGFVVTEATTDCYVVAKTTGTYTATLQVVSGDSVVVSIPLRLIIAN